MPITLDRILLYPVKSLGPVELKDCHISPEGLQFDRNWMIIDENGVMLSIREEPALLTLMIEWEDQHFCIRNSKLNEKIRVEKNHFGTDQLSVQVFDDHTNAISTDERINKKLSEWLNKPVQLVKVQDQTKRTATIHGAETANQIGFKDGGPILLIAAESCEDLSKRVGTEMVPLRFRPNFIVSGASPYAEDEWNEMSIGGITFTQLKKCSRCVITSYDPYSHERGLEPLKTLATYRKEGNRIFMGSYIIPKESGRVEIGDSLELRENVNAH